MNICLIFILNYYNTHYQYKCAIAKIWGYGILYLQFVATLHVNKGLIKNSVLFKIVKFSLSLTSYQWCVPQGAQSPQTLYYIILYFIALYYIIFMASSPLYFATCTVYIILYYITLRYFMASIPLYFATCTVCIFLLLQMASIMTFLQSFKSSLVAFCRL